MATKKAFIVGINDYAPIGVGGQDLAGCVNDAKDMTNTLVQCGFPPANIRILTNQNATRSKILLYLKWLIAGCKAGDSLVFYYSGHGTQVANVSADLEIDGMDEALLPHDYNTGGFIKDDDIKMVINANIKPKVNLEVIFDCCHSGTGTRAFNAAMMNIDSSLKVKMLEQSFEDEFYARNAPARDRSRVLVPVAGINHTLWAACADEQLSYESNVAGQVRGHFTVSMCRALRASNGSITRQRLDVLIKNALSGFGNNQTNQTESIPAEFTQNIFS